MRKRELFTEDQPMKWGASAWKRAQPGVGEFIKMGRNVFQVEHILPHASNARREVLFLNTVDSDGRFFERTEERVARSVWKR